MPLTSGGVRSLANNWFFTQAHRFRLFTGEAVTGSSGNEVTVAGYRAGSFGANPWAYDNATGTISNSNLITMGTTTEQSPTITHWGISDSTGALIIRGSFATPSGVLAANTVLELEAGAVSIRFPFA